MGNYLSLEQAAQLSGVNYEAFRKRKSIKELAKSTDCICQGASHVRLYPVELFPDDVRGYLRDAESSLSASAESAVLGFPQVEHLSKRGFEGFKDGQDSAIGVASGSTIHHPLSTIHQLLDPNSKESRLARASQDLMRIQGEWCECQGITNITKCDYAFSAAVRNGAFSLAPEILAEFTWGKSNGISRGSLMRVRAKLQGGLVDAIRNLERPKDKKIDKRPDLRSYIIAYVHEYAHANMTVLWQQFSL